MYDKDYSIQDFLKLLDWSESTFSRQIKLICDKYDIDKTLFQIKNEKQVYTYLFKKEWVQDAQLLFTMFHKNPFTRANYGKSLDVAFDDKLKYNDEIISMINNLYDNVTKIEIKSDAPYFVKLIENKLLLNIGENLSSITNFLSTADSFFSLKILNELDGFFAMLREYLVFRETLFNISNDIGEQDLPLAQEVNSDDNIRGYEYNNIDAYVAKSLKRKLENSKLLSKKRENSELLSKEPERKDKMKIRRSFFQTVQTMEDEFEKSIRKVFSQPDFFKIYDAFNEDLQKANPGSDIPTGARSEECVFFDLYLKPFKNEVSICSNIISKAIELTAQLSDITDERSILTVNINSIVELVAETTAILEEVLDVLNPINLACICYFKKDYTDSYIETFSTYLSDFIDIICLKTVLVDKYLDLEWNFLDIYRLKIANDELIESMSALADTSKVSEEKVIKDIITLTNARMISELFGMLESRLSSVKNALVEHTVSINRIMSRFTALYNAGDVYTKEISEIMRSLLKEKYNELDPRLKEKIKAALSKSTINKSSKSYVFDIFNPNK